MKRLWMTCWVALALAGVGCGPSTGTDAGSGSSDAGGGSSDAGGGSSDAGGGGGTDAGSMRADAGGASDAGGGGGTDAGPMRTDAGGGGGTDAGSIRADAGGGGGGTPGPECDATNLIIEEIDPGVGITIFNPTSAPIDTTGYVFCQRPAYPALSSLSPGITIPPNGRHTYPWPASFTDTNAGGELALYTNASFASAASLIDFVCWGSGHSPTRITVALADGDWVGGCTPAITDALQRIPGTDGRAAASYDPTGSSPALSCP